MDFVSYMIGNFSCFDIYRVCVQAISTSSKRFYIHFTR